MIDTIPQALVTDKQVDFINKLSAERGITVPAEITEGTATRKNASAWIDYIKTLPRASHNDDRPEIEDGMYVLDDTIYKVQHAVHGSGRQYAKRLIPGGPGQRAEFAYAPGIVAKLRPEHRMTMDQAREFGALYGTCCQCGAVLTNEDSIEAGIGPVCAGKI
jgi:hypothetical protein